MALQWGSGHNYQLGQTSANANTKKPSRVEEVSSRVVRVATSKLHSAILQVPVYVRACQGCEELLLHASHAYDEMIMKAGHTGARSEIVRLKAHALRVHYSQA